MGSLGAVLLFGGIFFAVHPEWLSAGNGIADAGFSIASIPASSATFYSLLSLVSLFYALLILVLLAAGVWAAGCVERSWKRHDDQRIVIDEVVGQLIALAPLIWFFSGPSSGDPGPNSIPPTFFFAVVTGFVLFRLFDVWKPGAVGWAERRFQGGVGVMADDVVAGLYSLVVLSVLLRLGILGFGTLGVVSLGFAPQVFMLDRMTEGIA